MNNLNDHQSQIQQELLDKTLLFPLGIPGFPSHHRFVLAQMPEEKPFCWLRSLEDDKLAFAVIEASFLAKDYTFEVDDADLVAIGSPQAKDCALLFILRVERTSKLRIEANMRAPIVINTANANARQVIIRNDTRYSEAEIFEF